MRVFWAILGVLMLAAAAYLMVSPKHAGKPGAAAVGEAPAPGPLPSPPPDPSPAPDAEAARPVAPREAPAQPPIAGPSLPASAESPAPAAPLETRPAAPGTPVEPADTSKDEPAPPPVAPPVAPAAAPPAPKPEPSAPTPADAAEDPKIEKQPDGAMLIDGKYRVTGAGTEADPYKVTWDQLVSVQADYVPKEGRNRIPGRARMLDGKWVEITGNIAFPLMAESADECLSMLNQWDGCCIGIPPTPYDAIEVRLKNPAEGKDRLATYGVIKGRMKVEPALVGGWLTGLYLMERATLTPQGYGGFAP